MRRHWRLVTVVTALASMWVFGSLYGLLTPCDSALASGTRHALWHFEGCPFGMQALGAAVELVGAGVGVGAGWVARTLLRG